ncbi:SusC/RagA family TonB-linked outer membrane protein [Chondrinema litorale]|uniref:SusC/RagA family TonB-linked outer membrane protein n=1 Tax=Chondrinema litorale TaxID=2994555 RepID=UPI002543CDB3|nr:SusC/RagA family TonB-linked outer membrane protein [Chondrinema litorale]UZR98416.1 SusC/RagA family TonB-linked outer membrane protein [Chondrinema litorale]
MKEKYLIYVLNFTKYIIIGCTIQCIVASILLASESNAQKHKSIREVEIEIGFENNTLKEVFTKIERVTSYKFSYISSETKTTARFSMNRKRVLVKDILDKLAIDLNLRYRQLNNNITFYDNKEETEVDDALAIKISGTIIDENGEPLPGVAIQVKDTNRGTITDVNGKYIITVSSEQSILVYSFIGYITQEIPVGNQTTIDITLDPDVQSLEEVIIVGYGEQKKETLTGAVSSIKTDELVQSPVANISNSLVGRLPGLIAMQSSGEPGYDQSSIKIRGIATLNSGSESDPLILVDGVSRSFNDLDPNEIASVTILKDASATAVFGVRGANGVIIVTTKTGSTGKPKLSYTSNFGFQSFTELPDLLDSYQYASLRNEASVNMGQTPYFSDQDLELYRNGTDPYFHPSVDWMDFILKDYTFQQQHNFNISGGTKATKYFISLGYFDQNGAYNVEDVQEDFSANPRYQRYNLRSNFDIDFNKNFTASLKLGGQFSNSNFPGSSAGSIFFNLLSTNPMMNPGIIDGKLISSVEGLPSGASNPVLSIVNNGYQNNFDSKFTANIRLDHKLDFILPGLKVRGMLAYDNYYQHRVARNKTTDTYRIIKDPEDSTNPIFVYEGNSTPFTFSEGYSRDRKIYTEGAFEYAHSFGDHNFTGLALYMQEKYTAPGQEYNVPRGYQGLVGRVTYNYAERYLAEFNMGYNGSENFPEGKRYGFFPSFSLGWVLTEEAFMSNLTALSFFKLRGSYGEVGNDKIGNARFLYLPSVFYPNSGGYYFGDYTGGSYQWYSGAQEGRIGNPDVTWERAQKTDIGVEIGMFRDKVRINADVFYEYRDNILAYLGTVPALVQANLPPDNIGEVENKGFEIELNYNNSIGKVDYWIKANYSFARNKILYQDEPERAYPYLQRTGQSVGQYFGLVSDGFYNTQAELDAALASGFASELQLGDVRYIDQNGDNIINEYDEVPIGYSRWPQIIYGVSLGFQYKGFDISALFQGAEKTSVYIGEMAAFAFDTDWRNATAKHLERWTPERYEAGETITYPRVQLSPTPGDHNYRRSDLWLKDASYLRLKNVELAYRFSGGFVSNIGLQSVRVFVNGNNLITWSKMDTFDPEAPEGRGEFYPQMKVYNCGVNIQF